VPRGRYERLYSGYKRRRSSYKGCSGSRSGIVYEVHLLAHETPVWTLLLSARIRANDPKLLALAELMSRYMSAPGTLAPKLKELVQLKVAAMVGCPF